MTPQQTDIPNVWPPENITPGAPMTLTPTAGYQGCIAIIPDALGSSSWSVVLYVDAASGGIQWTPPKGAIVMDVPMGFAINDGDAILKWVLRDHTERGIGGGGDPVVVKGHP